MVRTLISGQEGDDGSVAHWLGPEIQLQFQEATSFLTFDPKAAYFSTQGYDGISGPFHSKARQTTMDDFCAIIKT